MWSLHQKGSYDQEITICSEASHKLNSLLKNEWSQSKIEFILSVRQNHLHIQSTPNDVYKYTSFSENSDGLRQFVALLCFIKCNPNNNSPIILIDELEQHLHYNAQADIVKFLAQQQIASKVIYTTHSPGCLPEDLGSGVKIIAPDDKESLKSTIVNKFWKSREKIVPDGSFAALLSGMGAAAFAFFPLRPALIGEGWTEMILLPQLFREATGNDTLGFMITGGLSESGIKKLHHLNAIGLKVAFFVDSDSAGDCIKEMPKKQGVDEMST